MLYYNFVRITRASGKAFLILARHTLIDADKTARIELRSSVIFGWCNMKRSSRLEMALCMARNSKIIFGGGVKITDKFRSVTALTYRLAKMPN